MVSATTRQTPRPPDECDLVMQGGVTSGVAYPAAVMALHQRYRFRSIGGASVGAMAAAITAAAEYARDTGGFDRLESLRAELRAPGLIPSLFQPYREAAPILHLLLAVQAKRTAGAKAMTYVVNLLRWMFLPMLIAMAVTFGLTVLFLLDAHSTLAALGFGGWLIIVLALIMSALIGFLVGMTFALIRMFRTLPANYFGLCPGTTLPGKAKDALTDWLYKKIQFIAGKSLDDPLTFADLETKGIRLQLMTTDVSGARPLRMPNRFSSPKLLFAKEELTRLFPKQIIDYLNNSCPSDYPATSDVPELHPLPNNNLPVIVATRMSLSFPLLLSAVPLWVADGNTVSRHWFADGGISSNFPIQFFDEWLPTRPTFGLYFGEQSAGDSPNVLDYVQRIANTALNWHDATQAELPGFRERIQRITLSEGQGGFNLTMTADALNKLETDGTAAGQKLTEFDFPQHWLERYTILMRMMQHGLVKPDHGSVSVADAYCGEYRDWLANGVPGAKPPDHTGKQWCAEAAAATDALIDSAAGWLPTQGSFIIGPDPEPPAVMRITPDV